MTQQDTNENRAYNVPRLLTGLGLCAGARKLIIGTPAVITAVQTAKPPVRCVISVCDASPATAKKLRDKTTFYRVPLFPAPIGGEELAHAVGKTGFVAAVCVTDADMYRMLTAYLPRSGQDGNQPV